nr:YCF48-related protein [Paenibacillus hamazuiensis]
MQSSVSEKKDSKAISAASIVNKQTRTALTDFWWINAKTGFVWGAQSDGLKVFRTDDGGANWSSITPDGYKISQGVFQKGRGVVFTDSEHGWIGASMEERPAMILSTVNGGRGWVNTPLDKATYPLAASFITPKIGWLLTSTDAAMGSSEKALYSTQDGGAAWNLVTQTEYNDDPSRAGALPLRGFADGGLIFTDPRIGWLPLTNYDYVPTLYRTKDGGKTWAQVELPVPDDRKGSLMNLIGAPVFCSQEKGRGWLQVGTKISDDRWLIDAYTTADGGEHWTLTPLGLEGIVFILDSANIWGWKDGTFVHTPDSGKTWEVLAWSGVLADAGQDYPRPLEMQFLTPQIGWLLLGSEDGRHSLLLGTQDGGASWAVM